MFDSAVSLCATWCSASSIENYCKIFGHGTEIMKLCQGIVGPIVFVDHGQIRIMQSIC
jgi:hypothetical protein